MRLRRPSLWLILPAMYSTWFVHVKSDDIKIPRYLKLLTLFTLWSKIDTVRAILLSNFLLLPTSIHLVFSRFKVSLWSFSHFATPNKCDLAYHWAPGKMSLNSKSRCRLHIGTHSSIPECLADKDYKKMNIFYCLFVFYLFIYLFDILLMPGFIIHLLAFLDIDWC